MTQEVWKTIEDFPNYEVSNLGNVRNIKSKNPLKQKLGRDGHYLSVFLTNGKKENTQRVHRLVAEAFLGKRDGLVVNHIDGDKLNNNINNLEWCTVRENNIHAIQTGLNKPGAYQKKPVRVIETGEIFDGVVECAEAVNGDFRNVYRSLNDPRNYAVNGLHFEYATEEEKPKPTKKPFLYDYQMDAVNRVRNGSILCGSVGSGKSRTGLFYYFKENGGWIDENGYTPMKNPQDLIIITTAKKRNSMEWMGELANFLMYPGSEDSIYNHKIVVESWNNIHKFQDMKGAFFLLDEQRLVSYGAWTKAFLKIAKNNNWILLTATPGDTYMDYLPVFLANGFFKNKTEFTRNHCIYSRYTKYPKIDGYRDTQRLDRLRRKILVQMNYKHEINMVHEDIYCNYNIPMYKDVAKKRWDPYKDEPIINASGLCYIWRKIVNSDESRQVRLLEILEDHPKVIIFYNHNYELEILRNLVYPEGTEIAEYNGQKHQDIPNSERWVYLCQYNAASEGWECIKTNVIVFYSQNYSYKMMTQAAGRIDRLNTPFDTLYYYHLKTRSGIDLAISKALKEKRNFNENRFVNRR